jgi:uncharacterized protein DUF4388
LPSKSGLSGNLSTMPLPDLLQWIGQGRKTGALVLQRGSLVKRLYFRDGDVVSSASNEPREFLGQIMVSQQLISEARLKEAFDIQGMTRVMLGRVLVQKGWAPEEAVAQALRRKTEETVYSLFLWSEGEFLFEEGASQEESAISIRLKVEGVLLEGLRRYDLAQKIRRAFPTSAVVLSRTATKPPADLLANAFARRALELVDGERSLKDVCLELHAPEFTVSYFLLSALERGYVRIEREGPREKGPAGGAISPERIRQARELVDSGAFEEALVILEGIREAGEGTPEVHELAHLAELNLIDRFYKGPLPPKMIPRLEKSLDSLLNESLTPEEVFLVSRINGSWDLKSIVSISPLREVDALRVLKRLQERAIISLKPS